MAQREAIKQNQAILILIMFIFGSSVVMGVNSHAGQDSWISLLFSLVAVMPVVSVYARIIKLFPGVGFGDILTELFGKIAAKGIMILMTWYAIHLGALVIKNFSEFIQISSLLETPQLSLQLFLFLTAAYLAKSGIKIVGRWALVTFYVVIFVIILTITLALQEVDFSNLLPFMGHDIGSLAAGALQIYSFPFLETVLFLMLSGSLKAGESPYKIYLYATLIAVFVLAAVMIRNIVSLGTSMTEVSYFSSYTATRTLNIGKFLTRIEGTIIMNFILTGITKITVCLMAATTGFCELFHIKNTKQFIVPVGLLMVALSSVLYKNTMEMFAFVEIYTIYAFPFQIIIPFVIWIFAEFKTRKNKNKNLAEAGA